MEFYGYKIDFWTVWGLLAQGVFFSSFVVQWWKSERKKKSHLPAEFWYLRLLGAMMLFVYVVERRDLVFLLATVLQSLIYIRNIALMRNKAVAE